MQALTLNNEPNQQFAVVLEEVNYQITLRALDGAMLLTLTADDEEILTDALCFAGQPLLIYPYQVKKGNFIFQTENYQYPFYTDFEKTCFLYYLTEQEWQEVQNG